MRRISVFGSTGSVGQNTIDLISRTPDVFEVVALSGGRNIDLLIEQAKRLKPDTVVTAFDDELAALRDGLAGTGVKVAAGRDALLEAASRPTDWAMQAVVGFAGLEISLKLARSTSTLALANKESLVCGGALLRAACRAGDTTLLPVDSEHSAIFQCIADNRKDVERIILTASGGPFLNTSLQDMETATPEQAVAHPNWDMGQRISIDSASMFNKAMEMIETHELFDVEPDQIEVLVHPESIVHSMVGFCDGAILSHLGPPDMRSPIGFALNWPQRNDLPVERLDFGTLGTLTFRHPDRLKFPALGLAEQVMCTGGASGAAFNAAKEQALDLFLERKVGFLDMAKLVETVLDGGHSGSEQALTLDQIKETDAVSRAKVNEAAGL